MRLILTAATVLTAFILCWSVPSLAIEEASGKPRQERGTIHQLIDSNDIEVEIEGEDIENVRFRIKRNGNRDLVVVIPVGTYLDASSGNVQNMVTTSERTLELTSSSWEYITVPAACATMDEDIPESRHGFRILESYDRDLEDLMEEIEDSWATYETVQAAIWIVTDNVDYDGLDMLVDQYDNRVITVNDTGRAMKLVDDAGIDITRKRIWSDWQYILRNLTDRDIEDWLREKSNSNR